ncbi:MAG: gephyrin-like molybdotransferase Glp [Myxococcota bacterium]
MLPIGAALEQMLGGIDPLGLERVSIAEALGRVLAVPFVAVEPHPRFDQSAMDGYAVRAEEATARSELLVVGEAPAGSTDPPSVAPGQAVRIFTGGPIPPGADAVVLQENVRRTDDRVVLQEDTSWGQHIRTRASDVAQGEVVVAAGVVIDPGVIGVLSASRRSWVSVYRRPRVAILSTGDELADMDGPIGPHQVVASNGPVLASLVRLYGGDPVLLPKVSDRQEAITGVLLELKADLVVSTGGVSVGDYDQVTDASVKAGKHLVFNKLRLKPGKPSTFLTGTPPHLALPGNPTSAIVTFEVLGRPLLRKLAGDHRIHAPAFRGLVEREVRHRPGRTELVRCMAVGERDGRILLRPARRQGSGSVKTLAQADSLLILPFDEERIESATEATAIRLFDPRGAVDTPLHRL